MLLKEFLYITFNVFRSRCTTDIYVYRILSSNQNVIIRNMHYKIKKKKCKYFAKYLTVCSAYKYIFSISVNHTNTYACE